MNNKFFSLSRLHLTSQLTNTYLKVKIYIYIVTEKFVMKRVFFSHLFQMPILIAHFYSITPILLLQFSLNNSPHLFLLCL